MGKSTIYVTLNFISIDGVPITKEDKITLWVGYGQRQRGFAASRAVVKRNNLDIQYRFKESSKKKPAIYIYAYRKRALLLKNQLAGCAVDLTKVPAGTTTTHILSMKARDTTQHITISVTIRRKLSGQRPTNSDAITLVRINSENYILNEYNIPAPEDETGLTSYLC